MKDVLEGKLPADTAIIRIVRQKEGNGPYHEPGLPLYVTGRYEA